MSGRYALSQPIRLAFRSQLKPRTTTRCLHNLPRRPHTLPPNPRTNHPTPLLSPLLQHTRRTFAKDSTRTFFGNARILFRNSPLQFSLAILILCAATGMLVYLNYFYQTYILGAYHNFPPEVAAKLRRAIYFTKTDLQPNEAVKYYKQALQVAEEVGMDPMSDEVMGVKIEVAGLMERIQNFVKAIEVLERVRADNLRWIEVFGDREDMDMKKKRTRILGKTVAVHVKLAEHYSNPAVWERDMAEERLVWAIETVFKERQRRDSMRVTEEEEGAWMSDDEIGAATEALAQNYADKEQHYLATPLYLQCLALKETTDCHTVTLMSNLAGSLAQQSPRAARAAQSYAQSTHIQSSSAPSGPVATKEQMIQNAQLWAQKAIDVAAKMRPEQRTEECDVGCVVATHNLGELAEMLGDRDGARTAYGQAVSLARKAGWQEGVENSSARLRELGGTK
ncbi:hypothetical protein LTR37_007739 [Vermiconidia calcicola]|uniref:Uncharacterized protein n=1 Tax=Vermiconidia calcicola TaxID=1690605 RepID=A0ACC3NCF6_9PEZI|nr:hypothetical protein LTR37_007739 [Vermiconidia calcicola]